MEKIIKYTGASIILNVSLCLVQTAKRNMIYTDTVLGMQYK